MAALKAKSSVVALKREMNLFHTTTAMIGVMVGSGIFVSPVSIVHHAGSVAMSLILWVVSGLITLLIMLCYAELGAMFPKAGGEYHFYKRILGPLPAFMFAWINLISYLSVFFSILSLAASEYLLNVIYPDCHPPKAALILFSLWLFVSILIVNSLYVKYVAVFQTVCTITKISSLAIIIIGGIVQLAKGKTEILMTGFDNTNPDPSAYAIAIYAGVFSYGGWNHVFGILEEVKHPERVVPWTAVISILTVTALYTLTNIAYFSVLTPEEMMASPVVALRFAEKTLGKFSILVPFLVGLSCIGAINGAVFGGSRVSFAAARDDLFPSIISAISLKYRTPWPSLFVLAMLAVVYVSTGSAVILIEYIGFITLLIMCLCVGCMLYLRYKEPDLKRPIKVPISVAVGALIFSVIMLLLGLYNKPRQCGLGVLMLLSGIPVYLLGPMWKSKPSAVKKFMVDMTVFVQKLLLVAPTDAESETSDTSETSEEKSVI